MNFSHKNNKISSGLGIVAKDSSLNGIKEFPAQITQIHEDTNNFSNELSDSLSSKNLNLLQNGHAYKSTGSSVGPKLQSTFKLTPSTSMIEFQDPQVMPKMHTARNS
jgi:hypothetical protein